MVEINWMNLFANTDDGAAEAPPHAATQGFFLQNEEACATQITF